MFSTIKKYIYMVKISENGQAMYFYSKKLQKLLQKYIH